MAKKFIEFIEAAAIIVLTAVLVVGVINYAKTNDEQKEETPIVEGAEILTLTVTTMDEPITITYEKGMTWREWVASDYNNFGVYEQHYDDGDSSIYFDDQVLFDVHASDLIDGSKDYGFTY